MESETDTRNPKRHPNMISKKQELEILTAAASSLGRNSYCGPLLEVIISQVEMDMRSDFLPEFDLRRTQSDCAAMRETTRKECEALIESARAEANKIMDNARRNAIASLEALIRSVKGPQY